jgi:hypothetical protein
MDSHSSDAFRLSSAARVQARTQRPLPLTAGIRNEGATVFQIRELGEAVKSAGLLTLGLYGGSRSQRRKFAARLSIEKLPVCGETESTLVPEHDGITGVNGERPWVIPDGRSGS